MRLDQARRLHRIGGFGILWALAAHGVLAAAGAAQLRALAVHDRANAARVLLTLSAPVTPRMFRLHTPERVVLDLPGTRRGVGLPHLAANGVVRSVRSGHPDAQTLRLVFELQGPLHARLVRGGGAAGTQWQIDLGPSGPAASTAATSTASPASPASSASATGAIEPVRPEHAPRGQRDIVVAVDAGHGGEDPGATGLDGTHEKDVTLAIARSLAARIDRAPGMRAVLTRDGDYFVALRERMERARNAHADMFVSIHADAVRDRGVSGASVYILSERGASSEAARMLAEQENAADLKGGIALSDEAPALRSVLLDLSQNASIGESVEAAGRVLSALDNVGEIRRHEVQQAAFVVLKSPDIPSMLIETAYISNPAEEHRLRSPAQQQRLAEAIFSGISAYFRQYPPEGSLFARTAGQNPGRDGS